MEKLTREQRNQVYRMALEILKSDEYTLNWACEAIRMACGTLGVNAGGDEYMLYIDALPEFKAKKPHTSIILWWDWKLGKTPRIEALTQCIEETNQ